MHLRTLFKDSVVYGGADLFAKLIAFFTFPLIAAALSPVAFGSLELLVTSTTLLGLIANCGINNALQRFYWDSETAKSQRPALVSSGLAIQVVFAFAAVTFGMTLLPVIGPLLNKHDLPLTWIAIASALILMAVNQWTQYLLDVIRLHMAPWKFLGVSLISRALTAGVGVCVVVSFKWGLDGLLMAQACVALIILPVSLVTVRSDLTPHLDKAIALKIIRFGHPFIFVSLAFWLFGSMDRWMLAAMSSVEEVGIYSVAYRFASAVMFVSVAFGQAWSPLAMKIRAEHPLQYRAIFSDVLMLLACVMLVLGGGVALFSGELINILMPREYAGAALPLAVLSLGVVLQSTQQVTAVGISIEKKTFLFARLAWLAAAINFVLNWLLIPRFGAAGSAWATTASYLVLTGGYLYFTQRLHPLPLRWRRIAIWGLLLIAFAWLANIPSSSSFLSFTSMIKVGFLLASIGVCYMLAFWRRPHNVN